MSVTVTFNLIKYKLFIGIRIYSHLLQNNIPNLIFYFIITIINIIIEKA